MGFWGWLGPLGNADPVWSWEGGVASTGVLAGWAGLGVVGIVSGLVSGVSEALGTLFSLGLLCRDPALTILVCGWQSWVLSTIT